MDNFSHLSDADLCDMLADYARLETERALSPEVEKLAYAIWEELRRREFEAMLADQGEP